MFFLQDITKKFGDHYAIKNLNISIKKGDRIALIGSSGSGKTTLLKLLNSQHLPTSGTLKINAKKVEKMTSSELRSTRSKIAYIPQDLGIVPSLRVFQNVLLGKIGSYSSVSLLRQFFFPSKKEIEKIHNILNRVGIGDKLYLTTSSLSGGQKQRVAVARALYQEAHTILADEPVSSVDPTRAKDLVGLLNDICADNNLTLVMSIHALELAKEHFPRLIALKEGQLYLDNEHITDSQVEQLYKIEATQMVI